MFAISIKSNFPGVQRALEDLHDGIRDRALASAINKTLEQGKTQMIRAITNEFNLSAAYVRERLRIRRATTRGGFAIEGALIGGKEGAKRSANIIAYIERSASLAELRKRTKSGTRNQLFVKIKRAGPKKPLGNRAFIGNKGRTVFERVGKSRLPIKPVQVIDVQQMFNTRRVHKVVVDAITAKFPAVFEHEAKFYLDRFNGGGR